MEEQSDRKPNEVVFVQTDEFFAVMNRKRGDFCALCTIGEQAGQGKGGVERYAVCMKSALPGMAALPRKRQAASQKR